MKTDSARGGAVVQWVKLQLALWAFHVRIPFQVPAAPLEIQLPANVPKRQSVMAQGLRKLLSPMRDSWILASVWHRPSCCSLGSEPAGRIYFLSCSLVVLPICCCPLWSLDRC